uniref:Uncharacterized protein n=1 Tax=Anguilla anguilla TaxID=7936 RepID=A0A0E9TM00_ANGAN
MLQLAEESRQTGVNTITMLDEQGGRCTALGSLVHPKNVLESHWPY